MVMALLPSTIAFTQTVEVVPNLRLTPQQQRAKVDRCHTVPYMESLHQQAGISSLQAEAQFENWMGKLITERRSSPRGQDVINYNLPVVFHIIHSGQTVGVGNNISQARIQSQLAQINKDFANLSNSPYAVAASTGIQFSLAQRDPSGNLLAEAGIDRVNAPGTIPGATAGPYSMSNFNSVIKPATIWDPTRYLNIWVAELDDEILGYATFPTSSTLPGLSGGETASNAGVVVLTSTVGSLNNINGTCTSNPYNAGKTLTHELGHFFGLRHIWGDATCGNDFVSDTPIHEEDNDGRPAHPKPNSCGTPDEMFENYMDYCYDDVLNTFTAFQVERIQTVMANSPRRKELATSNVGLVPFTSNRVAFLPCFTSVTYPETGTAGSIPRHRDLEIPLNFEDRASGPATITINTGGTATANVDYILQTPSFNVAAGDGFKVINLRIIDDGIAEPTETIILTFTISGSGVTAGTSAQSYTITITDDDNITIAQNAVLLNENFDGTVSGWSTLVANQNQPNRFVLGTTATGFTGRSIYISNNAALGQSAPHEYTGEDNLESVAVVRSPLINATGLRNLRLSYRWKSNGETDPADIYDYGTLVTAAQATPTNFATVPSAPLLANNTTVTNSVYNFPASFNGAIFHLGFYWENDNSVGNQPPLAFDELVLTADGTRIEQTVNSNRGHIVNAGTTVNFTSIQDGELITTISNASGSIGGVEAVVQQAGTTQVDITTPQGTFKRSAKVIRITPVSPYTGTARITLYYTQAEVAIWDAAVTDLRVMQVNDGVNLTNGTNQGNARILTPTVDNQLAARGYISYTVEVTGFSQFFLVEPSTALPLQLTEFEAKPSTNAIVLNWNTLAEYNNQGFDVERSTNGTEFAAIGTIAGQGRGSNPGNYTYQYVDDKVAAGITYYYRLRQTDIDGKVTYTAIRSARLAASRAFSIFPNPAKDKFRLVPAQALEAAIDLLNMQAQLVRSWPVQAIAQGGIELSAAGLPAGVYTLRIKAGIQVENVKLVIE